MFLQLLLVMLFRQTFSCTEEFSKVRVRGPHYEYEHGYQRFQEFRETVFNATIICTNLTSSTQIRYSYEERDYEQFLNVSNSKISIWEPSQLSTFSTITKLYLTGNHIETILPGAFNGLIRLRELYVNNNDLKEVINGVYNSLHRLEILDLSQNRILKIYSYALMGLSSLKTLYLGHNNIKEIEESITHSIGQLQYLNLSKNPLETISLEPLSSIDNLIITNTKLSYLSEDLSNLTVKMVNLSSNHFSEIDFSIFPKANTIDLSNNLIENVENCEYLDTIKIFFNGNKIQNFTCIINGASVIGIQHNKIKYFENNVFGNSTSVRELHLGFNSVLELDKNIFQNLTLLKFLSLQNNEISELNPGLFRDLVELKFLYLSHNKIQTLQYGTFDNLKQLAILDISHNKLMDLHQYTFTSLSNLVYLHFDNNEISSFDASDLITHLPNLKTVSLDYNPWTCKNLVKMFKLLKVKDVTIDEGENYDDENFHGIRCFNKDKVSQSGNNTADNVDDLIEDIESSLTGRLRSYFVKPINASNVKNFVQEFQQSLRESLNKSKIQQFFNEDFANSKFFQYFNKDYSQSNFFKFFTNYKPVMSKENFNGSTAEKFTFVDPKPNKGDNAVVVFSGVILVVMLSLMVAMVFLLLKMVKKNETRRIQSESEMELC